MRPSSLVLRSVVLASLLLAPTSLFAQQSLNLYVGGFVPRGEDARVAGDVLVSDLDFFRFKIKDFTTVTAGGEWLVAIGDYAEAGLGIGISSRSVPSHYRLYVNEDGSEIRQDLKLRIVPFTATVRFLPVGRHAAIQPYVGGGVSVLSWRYTETGEFIDFDGNIFRDRFKADGTATTPVILGGVRIPFGDWDIGGEIRHQAGTGDLNPNEFADARKIDLGGFSYLATFNIRF